MSPIIVGGRTLFGSLSSQPTGITTAVGSEYYDTVSYTHLTLPTILLV